VKTGANLQANTPKKKDTFARIFNLRYMTNTYLLEVIESLQPNKRQEMALFLASSSFNRGKNAAEIKRLYEIILDAAPGFQASVLTKERVYAQVFSESNIMPGRLEKVVSDLNKLLREFVLMQQYFAENNEDQQQIDWARWLRMQGLSEISKKVIDKLKIRRERETAASLERYRTDLLIAEEGHEWESIHNQFKGDLDIPRVLYHLDLYYYNYRMELTNRYLLQQKGTQLPDMKMTELGTEFYQKDSILLRISKKIHDVLKKDLPTVVEFKEMIGLLQTNENALGFQTLAQFYTFLRNTCTLMINGGHLNFNPVLHEIHKDNLERGYFFVNCMISPNVYLNLVTAANNAMATNWAMEFTEKYKRRVIGDEDGSFFYGFNMAKCLFIEKRYEEALDHIPDAPSSSHYHHMVRRLEIKIYYELHSDLLLYKIDAFRKFIVRTATKTIAANLRTMDLNFLNILMQLTQTPKKDKARSARLIARIEGKKLVADRAWLLEKARELG